MSNSSTVSLRGKLELQLSSPPASTDNDAGAATNCIEEGKGKEGGKDDNSTQWTWVGQWAFGPSVKKALMLPIPKRGPTASKPRTQPFRFQFVREAKPSDVLVPSMNFPTPSPQPLQSTTTATTVVVSAVETPASGPKKEPKPHDGATNADTNDTTTNKTTNGDREQEKNQQQQDQEQSQDQDQEMTDRNTINNESGLKSDDAVPKTSATGTAEPPPLQPTSSSSAAAAAKEQENPPGESKRSPVVPTSSSNEQEKLESSTDTKVGEQTPTKTVPSPPPKVTFGSVMPGFTDAYRKYSASETLNNETASIRLPKSGQWKGYFENIAGRDKKHKQKLIKQNIDETFYLFFNATPSDDAKFGFEEYENGGGGPILDYGVVDDDERKTQTDVDETKRPQNIVQVRGCGENQFGDFEIFGYLNIETMTMEIQRQYVFPPEVKASEDKSSTSSTSPASSRQRKSGSNFPSTSSRPSSTRKRQPTWKRLSVDQEEDELRERRKKAKLQQQQQSQQEQTSSMSQQSQESALDKVKVTHGTKPPSTSLESVPANTKDTNIIDPSTSADGATSATQTAVSASLGGALLETTTTSDLTQSVSPETLVKSKTAQPKSSAIPNPMKMSSSSGSASSSGLTSLKISLPSQLAGPSSTASTPTTVSKSSVGGKRTGTSGRSRRSSPGGSTSRGSKGGSANSTPVPPPSNIRLPPVGDPKKARWRGPHFLYYQRHDPSETVSTPSGGDTSPKQAPAPATPKYVIYTGEMADGKREGRGLCLYNNGTLYQGFWKKGKEHGYGTIMTADRCRVIFEGNFERGKMSGFGTYYYASTGESEIVSHYTGEFRENQRNGMGRYVWSDGSEFNGNWNCDQMTHGTFSWPDGSTYMGGFKDSKRSGPGILRASDGFVYDGMWDNNAMEGRGLAIYPSGQRYEGLFSKGRREGRGTIFFTNGAVYEGRFRDDAVDGQGTMKMTKTAIVPRDSTFSDDGNEKEDEETDNQDFMIPISFAGDVNQIHSRAGFTAHGD